MSSVVVDTNLPRDTIVDHVWAETRAELATCQD